MSLPADDRPAANGTAECPNCSATIAGAFCHACGQRQALQRLDINELAADSFSQVLSFDSALWRTVRDMTLRPGRACRDYVSGMRRRYVNPLKYIVFAMAWLFLLLAVLELKVTDLSIQPELPENLPVEQRELRIAIVETNNDTLRWFVFSLPIAWAWVFGWLFRSRGYNFAELASFGFFSVGHANLLLAPWFVLFGGQGLFTAIVMALSLSYYTWAARDFFETTVLRAAGAVFLGYAVWLIGIMSLLSACVVAAVVFGHLL